MLKFHGVLETTIKGEQPIAAFLSGKSRGWALEDVPYQGWGDYLSTGGSFTKDILRSHRDEITSVFEEAPKKPPLSTEAINAGDIVVIIEGECCGERLSITNILQHSGYIFGITESGVFLGLSFDKYRLTNAQAEVGIV